MDVLILSSASENIDAYYLSIARSIANYLAGNKCNLIFGGCSTSMMGVCYEEFKKKNREIYAYTTRKYQDDLINLDGCYSYVKDNTFDMKKSMYKSSDFIVALPGGFGTISEFTSYIEENRSNDKDTPIIIYNEGGFYNPFLNYINSLCINGFISSEIVESFKVANNRNEFEDAFLDVKNKIENKKQEEEFNYGK